MITQAADIDPESLGIPRHVAIVMDGNNRWAKAHGLVGVGGHEAGERRVRTIVEATLQAGVQVLTLFAFSSENWRRPQEEVDGLMRIFLQSLEQRVPVLQAQGVSLRFIGDISAFDAELQNTMRTSMKQTTENIKMILNIAVNYGGQWDISHAALCMANDVATGKIALETLDAAVFARYLCMADLPPVDLLIRTGGEQRLSNFVLWQAAYAEFYFTECLWPDFDEQALQAALADFALRERRFGRTSAQIKAMQRA